MRMIEASRHRSAGFTRDMEAELRYLITFHPYGWLKKVRPR